MKNLKAKLKNIWCIGLICIFIAGTLTGCLNESDTATTAIKDEADNFNVVRELTIVNTRTEEIQCTLTGTFSLTMDSTDNQLEIISKLGENEYRRDLFHINDDTNYYVHNIDAEYADRWSDYAFEIKTYKDLHPTTDTE